MKKERITSSLYYFASICFYIVAIIKFMNGSDRSMGIVYLCLGSAMLCFGSVLTNKNKENDKEDKEQQ